MDLLVFFMVCGVALFVSCTSGNAEWPPAAYKRVVECIPKGKPPTPSPPYNVAFCLALKMDSECLLEPLNATCHREVFDFYRAYNLERIYLTRKSDFCPEPLPYEELRGLVRESGIMEKEHLPSIENDTYVECAGTVQITCVKVAARNLEKGKNVLQIFLSYINCYDKETKACPFPIARNINVVIQAFKKHIYAHHGLLAKMLKKIIPGRGAVNRKHSVKTYNRIPL